MSVIKAVKGLLGPNNMCRANLNKIWRHTSPEMKQLVKENSRFRNQYAGQRCFIIGSGPSIKEQDLSLLKNEYTFTVNQLARNDQFHKIQPTFHVWSDPEFFDEKMEAKEKAEIEKCVRAVYAADSHPDVFYIGKSYESICRMDLPKDKTHFFVQGNAIFPEFNGFVDYSTAIPSFRTVIHYCITLAVYMGFSEIYLLGCDCTGFVSYAAAQDEHTDKNYQYGYAISDVEKKRMQKAYSKPIDQLLIVYGKLIRDYSILEKYCRKHQAKLVNCTAGGVLNSLERQRYEDVCSE